MPVEIGDLNARNADSMGYRWCGVQAKKRKKNPSFGMECCIAVSGERRAIESVGSCSPYEAM